MVREKASHFGELLALGLVSALILGDLISSIFNSFGDSLLHLGDSLIDRRRGTLQSGRRSLHSHEDAGAGKTSSLKFGEKAPVMPSSGMVCVSGNSQVHAK